MAAKNAEPIAEALRDTLISPNESDRNLEPANVTDGLFAIARAITFMAKELGKESAAGPGALEHLANKVEAGSQAVAVAIERLADAIENAPKG